MKIEKELIPVSTRITIELEKKMVKLLANDPRYINKADYIRDLIRRDLESREAQH